MAQLTIPERLGRPTAPRKAPLPLRLFGVLAIVGVGIVLAVAAASGAPSPKIELTAGGAGTISISNSREGLAILSAGNMRPGDQAGGSVTVGNTGDGAGTFTLSTSALVDTPGAGGGDLSEVLDLRVEDVTNLASPVSVYSGGLDAVGTVALGALAAGETRTYDFTATFLDGGVAADDAYQGSAVSVTFDWNAVRIDPGPPPALASSSPDDGSVVASASSISLTATVPLQAINDLELDGAGASASISGSDATVATGALSQGPHTLAGELEGTDGARTPFRVHFTVWNQAGGDYPYVEKNSASDSAMTLTAVNGEARILAPAGAWSGGGGDWIVFRLDPRPAAAAVNGWQGDGDIVDVAAYWALSGVSKTSFDAPLRLTLTDVNSATVPATFENGAWRRLSKVPSAGLLPGGWADGYYRDGSGLHILTRHISTFAGRLDVQAPTSPGGFKGRNAKRRLVLQWKPATDNSAVAGYVVYGNGAKLKTLGPQARTANLGRFKTSDRRVFQVAATDAAGNESRRSARVAIVPTLRGLTVAGATARLKVRALVRGKVTYVSSSLPAGRVVSASRGGVLRAGTKVGLKVSNGRTGASTAHPGGTNSSGSGGGSTGSSGGGTFTPPLYPTTPTSAPSPAPAGALPPLFPTAENEAGGAAENGAPTGPDASRPVHVTPLADEESRTRKILGLALLGGALGIAAAAALRPGLRPRRIRPQVTRPTDELELVFWDQRLARSAARAVRRLSLRA